MKKALLIIIMLATIISTAFVFTACGSSDNSSSDNDSTEATTTTSVEESQLASQAEELNKDEAKELLSERYRWQLSCYAEALKRIFSRKISGAMIYSTALGEAFSVDADMLEA